MCVLGFNAYYTRQRITQYHTRGVARIKFLLRQLTQSCAKHAQKFWGHAHLRINKLAVHHGALFWLPILEKHHLRLDNREIFDHTMYLGLLFLYIGLQEACSPQDFIRGSCLSCLYGSYVHACIYMHVSLIYYYLCELTY